MRALALGLLGAGLLALIVLGWMGLPGFAHPSVPLDPIEAPFTTFAPWPIQSPDDLRGLLSQSVAAEADRVIAFPPYRRGSDFRAAGVSDSPLIVRLVRMSNDSTEVPQAVAVAPDGRLVARWQITSVPTGEQTGICVAQR
jgi:hypothetical protein